MARAHALRSLIPRVLAACVLAGTPGRGRATDVPACIELVVETAPGLRTTRDQPMIALWIEQDDRFVRTLWRFSKAGKYWPDMEVWHGLSAPREKQEDVDAVTGATIIQGDAARLRMPSRWNGLDLLSGRYVLRIESAKDHGKHYSAFRIPLGPGLIGRTISDRGYVRAVSFAAAAAGAKPTTIEAAGIIPPRK
jgi:hypothetical protein